jgi:hypothetical protein
MAIIKISSFKLKGASMIANEKTKRPPVFNKIPEELKRYNQWVAWKAEQRGDGKATKIPVNPNTGRYASTNQPETWGTYDEAVTLYNSHKENGIAGIGFVFTKADPFCGVDLDDCYDPETGRMEDWAYGILKDLNSYSEISPSNRGVKIFAKGNLPGSGMNTGNIEMYDTGRYFTVTGAMLNEFPSTIENSNGKVASLYNKLSAGKQEDKQNSYQPGDTDIDSLPVSVGTKKLIREGEKYPDRSEAIISVVNALVGGGVSEADIFRIFDTYPIGEKYREKGSGKNEWIKGEIKRARDHIKKNHRGDIKVSATSTVDKIDGQALADRAKDILDSKEPCGSFDTSGLPTILDEYIQSICETTEAEPMIVTQSVLCTLSALIKKKCFIPEGQYFQMLFPNLWTLTIAPSGDFKTTGLNKGANLAWLLQKEINDRLNKYEEDESEEGVRQKIIIRKDSAILPNRVTAEGLLTSLSEDCGGMILCSEFGEWLENLTRSHNQGLKPLLTDLYDVPVQYSYKRSNRESLIVNRPFITINGVSTLSWIRENLKPSDVSSGFFARFLLFYPPHKKVIPPALPVNRRLDYSNEDEIRRIINDVPEDYSWFISDQAKHLFHSIHDSMYKEIGRQDEKTKEFLSPYLKRWSPYVLKIAMILQPFISNGTNQISKEAIEGAYSIVEYAIKSTNYLFNNELGETKQQTKQRKVLEYIAKHNGKVKRSVLQKSKVLGGGTQDYEYILETLETAGEIVVDRTSKWKGEWVYILTT